MRKMSNKKNNEFHSKAMSNSSNHAANSDLLECLCDVADTESSNLANVNGTKLLLKDPKVSATSTVEEKSSDSRGWTPYLVLASITCCLGSAVPAGYNIGVMNNAAPIMKQFCNKTMDERFGIQLSSRSLDALWATLVSIFLIGGVTGSLSSTSLSYKFGRRGALSIGNIFGIVGAFMFTFTPLLNSIELFLLGRLSVGLSGGLATSLIPTYMTEVAPLSLRGSVGVLCQLGITVGVLLGQLAGLNSALGTEKLWHLMLAAFAPLCICSLLITLVLPESPKYLFVVKEQKDKALKALSKFRNLDTMLLQNEIAELETELSTKSTSNSWTIAKILRAKDLRLPIMLVAILQFGQQLSGINAVFYYSSAIFESAGLTLEQSQFATIGTGLANIAMAVISVPLMSVFGRRVLLLTSAYLTIACLIILCFAIYFIHLASFLPWVCIITVLGYVIVYGIGLGPIPFFIGSELFDVGPRVAAMSIGSVCNWGGNFIVGMFFTLVQSIIGSYSFLIFAACVLFLGLFSRTYLPETRNKSTTEIAASITQGLKSRPNLRIQNSV